jgi:HEAT repeat protein
MEKQQRFPGFQKCMQMMRKRDAQVQEDGFHWLRPHAAEFVEELIAEFRGETKDFGLRCWLVELIGEARDPRAIPLIVELLAADDERLRNRAVTALRLMNTPEARRILFEAKAE